MTWAAVDLLAVCQKEDYLLPSCSWPQVTETMGQETTEKEGLLYVHEFSSSTFFFLFCNEYHLPLKCSFSIGHFIPSFSETFLFFISTLLRYTFTNNELRPYKLDNFFSFGRGMNLWNYCYESRHRQFYNPPNIPMIPCNPSLPLLLAPDNHWSALYDDRCTFLSLYLERHWAWPCDLLWPMGC